MDATLSAQTTAAPLAELPVQVQVLDQHDHEDAPEVPLSRTAKIATLLIVVLPIVGLISAIILLWGVGFSWIHLILLVSTYIVTMGGITVGFHRLFTHKSFETVWPVRLMLAIAGSMAIEGPLCKWVAIHRSHHRFSDTHEDPHSPHIHGEGLWNVIRGAWRSHLGWFFEPDAGNLDKYIPDLKRDKMMKWVSDFFPLWVFLSLVIPGVIGGLITMSWLGALMCFIWGGLVRVFLVHHISWSINSVCHIWGTRPFKSQDLSRNNAIFGLMAFGEGWHNNHHAFPTSARHGLRWYQIDLAYMFIRTLELLGLAKRVRVPSQVAIQTKLAR